MTTVGTAARHLRPRAWIAPIAVVTLLMSLLATMYLAYVVNPTKNLHDFPVALVNQDDGDTLIDQCDRKVVQILGRIDHVRQIHRGQ